MNVVLWIPNQNTAGLLNPSLDILSRLYGKLNILGAIVSQGVTVSGVKIIDKQDLKSMEYDLIVVSVKDVPFLITNEQSAFVTILKEATELGIDTDKIILDRVICIPNFTLKKYIKLRHSALSIFSRDCFGSWTYHRFGLPFLSPTINMFASDKDFLKFLKKPIENIKSELRFQKTAHNSDLNIDYPVFKIGETEWHMNHYRDFNVAFRKWYERSYRINWFNVLVVMNTESPEVLTEFDKLPFAKKVCFVPFETDLDSGFYINPARYTEKNFARLTHLMALGEFNYYDLWDMLLYGKKTLINK